MADDVPAEAREHQRDRQASGFELAESAPERDWLLMRAAELA